MKVNFSKGIYTNTEPVQTPEGFYPDAENMRVSGDAKRAEEGTKAMTGVPTNFIQWGNCSIGDKTILLGTVNGKSVIGSLDKNDVWTLLVPARAGVDVLGIVDETQVEGKKNWAGEDVIYFSTPSGARRINLSSTMPTDDVEFDKVTSLFLEYDLPRVTYTGEETSGELLSGTYEVYARLVTESGAATSFGISSSIIPVVQSNLNSSRASVTGNPPQTSTSKAIKVEVTNIDTAFKYIELAVLTYVGVANTPVVNITNQILVNDQSTIQFTYRGAQDDAGTITLSELITSGVAYSTGKFFAQKDGVLQIGAPTEAELPDINWFRVAENITSKFVVKRIKYDETLNFSGTAQVDLDSIGMSYSETSDDYMDDTYKNPVTCALFKGYRRNEVYSLTLTPVFVGGVYGPTIHIPANHAVATAPTNTDGDPNNGGTLGTYISEEVYPDDRYTGLLGTGLRLHKMPDAVLQPIIEGDVKLGTCYIRVLGIELSNIVLDPSELQYADKIAGFIIGRVDRRGQETQLAQGIMRPNVDIRYNNDSSHTRSTMLGDGYGDWYTDTKAGGTPTQATTVPGSLSLSEFTFLSPDIIHNLYTAGQASHIKQHSVYKADPYAAPMDYSFGAHTPRDAFGTHKCFFKNVLSDFTAQAIDQSEVELDGLRQNVGPFGVAVAPQSKGGKVNRTLLNGSDKLVLCSTNGFLWMKTLNGVNVPYVRDQYSYYMSDQAAGRSFDRNQMIYQHDDGGSFRATFIIHTLTRQNTKQYGPLDQMTSMFTHYQEWAGFGGTVEFFNGDTFINKYGLMVNDESYFAYNPADDADSPDKVGFLKPPHMSGIVYMWIESDNNYDYKHYIQPSSFTEEDVTTSGSMPYYPAYKQILSAEPPFGLLTMHADNWVNPGHADQYNTQYSTQPTTKPFVVTPKEDVEIKGSLVNRIIYSAEAVQGEKTDGYQLFLPNNYYDVPQEFGELTDVYVNKELFASTNQVQWRLFFNTLATQATSAGQVVLGTGGAFNRPAEPMTTVDGGYGGTSHWTHAINTVAGRLIVDQLQGKFFMLTDKLSLISQTLDDTDRLSIQGLNYNDIFVGSEPLRERVFIKLKDFMWSYNLERGNFISRHTYAPRWLFSHGPFMYSNQVNPAIGTQGVFKHSLGPTGVYYGKRHESSITIAANMSNTVSKQFNILELLTRRNTEEGLTIPFETFNRMEIWNDERYTGVLTITPHTSTFQAPGILEVLANKVKDSFRMNMSRDIVVDPSIDIFATSNHKQLVTDTVRAKWLPRMKGTYVLIKLISNNISGPIFIFDVNVELAENIR